MTLENLNLIDEGGVCFDNLESLLNEEGLLELDEDFESKESNVNLESCNNEEI